MKTAPIGAVVKVGGSLFDLDEFPVVLESWIDSQNPKPLVLIAGGGRWADLVRAADARFRLGHEAAHWLSIEAMRLTARLLADLLPRARLVEQLELVRRWNEPLVVLDATHFLRQEEPRLAGPPLPHGWQVTSDSIAARVALALGCSELVLLKSSLPAVPASIDAAAAAGYVDGHFALAARPLGTIRCVNIRAADTPEVTLKITSD